MCVLRNPSALCIATKSMRVAQLHNPGRCVARRDDGPSWRVADSPVVVGVL